ncbi:hypothetical protein N2152v2_005609 [Parachlorella kessleri]
MLLAVDITVVSAVKLANIVASAYSSAFGSSLMLALLAGSVGFTRRAGAGRVTHPSLASLLSHFPGILPTPQQSLQQPVRQPHPQPRLREGSHGSHTSSSVGGGSNNVDSSGGPFGSGSGAGSADSSLALVFGREERRSQPSLNLSHAVAVVLAQLFELRTHQLGGPDLLEAGKKEHLGSGLAVKELLQGAAGGESPLHAPTCPLPPSSAEQAKFVRRRALAPADQGQLEALLDRWAALLEGAGISAKESTGGGHKGAHGRRRKAMGHMRSLLLRGRANAVEVRALHGLAKELERRLAGESDPDPRSEDRGGG